MDIFASIQCLEDQGLITPEQSTLYHQIVAALPSGSDPLLALLVAQGIMNSQGIIVPEEPSIGNESIESEDDTDPQALTPQGGSAVVTVFGNNIIFRTDGGTPAQDEGHFAAQGSNFRVTRLSDFSFTAASATPATIFVSYYA